jgi:hypothetical protein
VFFVYFAKEFHFLLLVTGFPYLDTKRVGRCCLCDCGEWRSRTTGWRGGVNNELKSAAYQASAQVIREFLMSLIRSIVHLRWPCAKRFTSAFVRS